VSVSKALVVHRLLLRPRIHLIIRFVDAHGGALVNLIHGYTDNGDPFIRKFTDQLLEEVPRLCSLCNNVADMIFYRCRSPFLPPYTNGCSPASCMTHTQNSLSLWILRWFTYSIFIRCL